MSYFSTFRYARPSDNIAGLATITASAEDTNYPVEWLVDSFADQPGKLTTSNGWFLFDYGTPVRLDCVSLINPNFDASLPVTLYGDDTDAFTTPTLTEAFTIPARYADLFTLSPRVVLKDLHTVDATRTFRYWLVSIGGTNNSSISIGEIRMDATLRDFGARNIKWGSTRAWRRPAAVHETDRLVRHVYDYGTTVRAVQVECIPTDAVLEDIETWWRDACGAAKPFTLIPHTDQPDTWMATFVNIDQPYVRTVRNVNTITMQFQEGAKGLWP